MLLDSLLCKPFPKRIQVTSIDIKTEHVQSRNDAATRLRDWRMLDKKLIPNQLCLLFFRQSEKLFVGQFKITKSFSNQIVVSEKIINPPKKHLPHGRVIEMSVDIQYLSLAQGIGYPCFDRELIRQIFKLHCNSPSYFNCLTALTISSVYIPWTL